MVVRNREAILAVARRVFLERGYAGATLELIAEEAGFSKGVMYSQFASKADLYVTLLNRRIDERAQEQDQIVREHSGQEAIAELLESFARDAARESAWTLATIEFRALASRDADLNGLYAAAHARTVDRFASTLERITDGSTTRLAMPPRQTAELLLALGAGLVLEWAANPDALPLDAVKRLVGRAIGLESGSGG
jgi:AcrR family transcriptional regulator